LFSQLGQRRTVHALRTQHVYVIQLRELFGRECFSETENHVARVVDDNVEVSVFGNDLMDASRGQSPQRFEYR